MSTRTSIKVEAEMPLQCGPAARNMLRAELRAILPEALSRVCVSIGVEVLAREWLINVEFEEGGE